MRTMLALLLLTAVPCLASPKPQTITLPLSAAKTFQVSEVISQAGGTGDTPGPLASSGTIAYVVARPDEATVKFRVTYTAKDGTSDVTVSDNKTLVHWDGKQYQTHDAMRSEWPYPLMGLLNLPGTIKAAFTPVTVNGRPCLYVAASLGEGKARSVRKLWLDAKTHLPVRDSMTMTWKGKSYEVMRTDYSHWVLNAPIDPATFIFMTPTGAKEVPALK